MIDELLTQQPLWEFALLAFYSQLRGHLEWIVSHDSRVISCDHIRIKTIQIFKRFAELGAATKQLWMNE